MHSHRSHDEYENEGASAECPSAPKPLRPLEMEFDADRELERLWGIEGQAQSDR